MFGKLFVFASFLICATAHAEGAAETVTARPVRALDLGATGGINNPGGIYGIEIDYRLLSRLSLGMDAGKGAWGIRLTPQVRVYPFTIENAGMFVEAGLSLNLGEKTSLTVNDQVVQAADLLLTPTANVALGWRKQIGAAGWIALRGGYAVRLREDNVRTSDGEPLAPLLGAAVGLSQPGGIMVGLSGGYSLL